jgi:putative membrane protein
MPALKPEERQRVAAATEEIHDRTGVELVVVVRHASDHYALYPMLWASMIAIVSLVVLGLFFPRLPVRIATLLQALILLLLTLAFDWMPLRMRLVPRHTRHSLAHALAHHEFAAHAMAGDPGRKLILLFVSQAEHYFEVIADRATHRGAMEGAWEAIATEFTRAAKTGPLGDAVIEAVRRCGVAAESAATSPPERYA